MISVVIFISGRIANYKQCLLPIIMFLKKKYKVTLFLSINSLYEDKDVINCFRDVIGYYEFKPFFYDESWIKNRLVNNKKYLGSYNQLSCFYNDLNNFNLIEKYEKDNNIKFDVICKMRSDITFRNLNEVTFHKDDENLLILNNINLWCPIKPFGICPPLISDAICFGNKKSMELYCNTYNYIKEKDIEYKGVYNFTFEPYLNESLYDTSLYGISYYTRNLTEPSPAPPYTREEYVNIFNNNKRGFKRINYDWKYKIIRDKLDKTEIYTPPTELNILDELYIWKKEWGGLIHHKYINATNLNV